MRSDSSAGIYIRGHGKFASEFSSKFSAENWRAKPSRLARSATLRSARSSTSPPRTLASLAKVHEVMQLQAAVCCWTTSAALTRRRLTRAAPARPRLEIFEKNFLRKFFSKIPRVVQQHDRAKFSSKTLRAKPFRHLYFSLREKSSRLRGWIRARSAADRRFWYFWPSSASSLSPPSLTHPTEGNPQLGGSTQESRDEEPPRPEVPKPSARGRYCRTRAARWPFNLRWRGRFIYLFTDRLRRRPGPDLHFWGTIPLAQGWSFGPELLFP